MTAECIPQILSGSIPAVPSKSDAHRILICAALSENKTKIRLSAYSKDIEATIRCLQGLGTVINKNNGILEVIPRPFLKKASVDCGESGSTLRFLIPAAAALGINTEFTAHGRLPERPISPLKEELENHGVIFNNGASFPLQISGKLLSGRYTLPGNISSQFISGLLFALPILDGDSIITLVPPVESRSYINMTLRTLKKFGIDIVQTENEYYIKGNQHYHSESDKIVEVEGDWSNSSFFLCAGALSKSGITVTGLSTESGQGDKKIIDILAQMGADINIHNDSVKVKYNYLSGINIDASDIPDAVPVVSVLAAACSGTTTITNAQRLRLKESDRLSAISGLLKSAGTDFTDTDDGFIIRGGKKLNGGIIYGFGDHRIVMSGAVISCICQNKVSITDAEAVTKSYPGFFDDFIKLGGKISWLQ